jgi:hypothetical protein
MELSPILLSVLWIGLMFGSLLILEFKFKKAGFYIWSGIWLGFITLTAISVITFAVISGDASEPLGVILAYLAMTMFIFITYKLFKEGYLIAKYGGRKTIEFMSPVEDEDCH